MLNIFAREKCTLMSPDWNDFLTISNVNKFLISFFEGKEDTGILDVPDTGTSVISASTNETHCFLQTKDNLIFLMWSLVLDRQPPETTL